MKDFDQERPVDPYSEDERTFALRGERFVVKGAIRPDVLIPVERITTESPPSTDVPAMDEFFAAVLAGDGPERWQLLRQRDDDPVGLHEMIPILRWAVEVSTGRPTQSLSASGSGRETNGTGSTDDSRSPEPIPTG